MCSKRKEKKKERKKVNNQRLEKSKRKKIEKKEKEYEKGSWDQTMSEQMCRIVESKNERWFSCVVVLDKHGSTIANEGS